LEVHVGDEPLTDDAEVLTQIISSLKKLDPTARARVYHTIGTFFQLEPSQPLSSVRATTGPNEGVHAVSHDSPSGFSADRAQTPKQFLNDKQPRTDVERVACLSFYLTHYRDMPEFTTLDISKINTEAAQRKLANAAVAVNNAMQYGYLAPAGKGTKQISAAGERYVQSLPDYEAAKEIMASARRRRKPKKVAAKS
jgi:hypothetical protein